MTQKVSEQSESALTTVREKPSRSGFGPNIPHSKLLFFFFFNNKNPEALYKW